jgi:hypothetical protein
VSLRFNVHELPLNALVQIHEARDYSSTNRMECQRVGEEGLAERMADPEAALQDITLFVVCMVPRSLFLTIYFEQIH